MHKIRPSIMYAFIYSGDKLFYSYKLNKAHKHLQVVAKDYIMYNMVMIIRSIQFQRSISKRNDNTLGNVEKSDKKLAKIHIAIKRAPTKSLQWQAGEAVGYLLLMVQKYCTTKT